MKLQAFLKNAALLAKHFDVTPLLYGSLGLATRTGEPLNVDDIDILIPARFLKEEWDVFQNTLEQHGYTLTDEHEHTFEKDGVLFSYASIEELASFAGIAADDIDIVQTDAAAFRLLFLEQYLQVYTASAKDGYRIHVRQKKDHEKLALIQTLLRKGDAHV